MRNGSNNGPDLLGIDPDKPIIWLIEVKSSIRNKFPNVDRLDLHNRGKVWIRDAAVKGKIKGKAISAEAKAYAINLQALLDQGYKIKPLLAKVKVPKPGQVGTATIDVIPAKGP